jgi:hypothetical protein
MAVIAIVKFRPWNWLEARKDQSENARHSGVGREAAIGRDLEEAAVDRTRWRNMLTSLLMSTLRHLLLLQHSLLPGGIIL